MNSNAEPLLGESVFLYLISALYWQSDFGLMCRDKVYLQVPANLKKLPSYKLYQLWLVIEQVQSSENKKTKCVLRDNV